MANGDINARAQSGFSKAAAYDQHRPSYGPASVQLLLEQCRVAGVKHAKVLDLAAGTGKLTELLAARDEQFEVLAVEPHDGMRDVLAGKKLSGVAVRPGTAAKIDVPDESIDAVLVAQAFHWFASMDTLKELHRILKPHGMLGMIWNIEDYNAPQSHKATTAWEGKLNDLICRYPRRCAIGHNSRFAGTFEDNEPRFRHEKWRDVFDQQIKSTPLTLIVAADPLFSLPLGENEEHFESWLAKDKVWERFSTLSQIAELEGEDRERTHKTFLDAVNGSDVETNSNGEVAIHGRTISVWTSKVPADGRNTLTGVERVES
ncbi:hypothetical protein AMS68_005643 [Peltaster fructicola]|uniref:Methyltransferase type 11 domain-containing protein n=1 Tax=Peltaster fructicola TaxID=286661 RepID=A0A6H0XZM1_9PEZI|nr:hypothetical protein AMS68_005643 [Peltaster fructicola]